MRTLGGIAADLAAGFGLLTRIPVGWAVPQGAPYRPGRAVWTYPLVGLAVGAVSAACLYGARRIGLPPLLGAAWTVVATVLLTGGLHEDGLADTADGFGGGRTPARRLEIMRDSRIGSYGALALVLSISVRVTAVAALPPAQATAALLAAGALSRGAMLPVLVLPPARHDGLGQALGSIPRPVVAIATAIAAGTAILCLRPMRAAAAIIIAGLIGLGTAALAHRRLGGQTGDVLGACCGVSDCVLLTLLTAG